MDAEAFRTLLEGPLESGFLPRYGVIVREQNLWREAIALSLDKDPRVAFRSAGSLEHAYFTDRTAFAPHRDYFLETYLRVKNPSAHRHFGKITLDLLRRGDIEPSPELSERLAEAAFDRLIDPAVKVAVKAWEMDILLWFSERLPWVREQFEDTIRYLMAEQPTPGILSRGTRCLRALKNTIR